jgi:hypothetical protein
VRLPPLGGVRELPRPPASWQGAMPQVAELEGAGDKGAEERRRWTWRVVPAAAFVAVLVLLFLNTRFVDPLRSPLAIPMVIVAALLVGLLGGGVMRLCKRRFGQWFLRVYAVVVVALALGLTIRSWVPIRMPHEEAMKQLKGDEGAESRADKSRAPALAAAPVKPRNELQTPVVPSPPPAPKVPASPPSSPPVAATPPATPKFEPGPAPKLSPEEWERAKRETEGARAFVQGIEKRLDELTEADENEPGFPRPKVVPVEPSRVGATEMEKLQEATNRMMNDLASLQLSYSSALEKMGLHELLVPDRLAKDEGLRNSKAMLKLARQEAEKVKAASSKIMNRGAEIARSATTDPARQAALEKAYAKGVEKTVPLLQKHWQLEFGVLEQYEKLIDHLAKRRKRWTVRGGMIEFDNEGDLKFYNDAIDKMVAMVEEQDALRVTAQQKGREALAAIDGKVGEVEEMLGLGGEPLPGKEPGGAPKSTMPRGTEAVNTAKGSFTRTSQLVGWSKNDPANAIAWVAEHSTNLDRPYLMAVVIDTVADRDAMEAWKLTSRIEDRMAREAAEWIAFRAVCERDVEQGILLAKGLVKRAPMLRMKYEELLRSMKLEDGKATRLLHDFGALGRRGYMIQRMEGGPPFTYNEVDQMMDGVPAMQAAHRELALFTYGPMWMGAQPPLMLTFLEDQKGAGKKTLMTEFEALYLWGTRMPEDAGSWLIARGKDSDTRRNMILQGCAEAVPDETIRIMMVHQAAANSDLLPLAVAAWCETAPEMAAKYSETLPDDGRLRAFTRLLVAHWMVRDPEGVVKWARALKKQHQADYVSFALADYFTPKDLDAAFRCVGLINDETLREEALNLVSAFWLEYDPEKMIEVLGEMKREAKKKPSPGKKR